MNKGRKDLEPRANTRKQKQHQSIHINYPPSQSNQSHSYKQIFYPLYTMSNNTKQCKVKVRKVHDETISTLTGNMYFLTLNNDYTGYIIFTTIDTNANVVSIPYEVIVKVAFKTNFIKLMLDANNLKGPGIER